MAKSTRKSVEVKSENGRWSVRGSGATSGHENFSSKREAMTVARKIAREKKLDVIIYEPGRKFTEIRTSNPETARDSQNGERGKKSTGTVSPIRGTQKSPFQKKANSWREWARSHKSDTPILSDEAVSRQIIYRDRN